MLKAALSIINPQGDPCIRRSNQSIGRMSSPAKSISSFSQMCGGLNGARPIVRHNKKTTPHESFDRNFSILFPKALGEYRAGRIPAPRNVTHQMILL